MSSSNRKEARRLQDTKRILKKKKKNFKDPRLDVKPGSLPKAPQKPKPKSPPKGSNMKSYDPMGAGMRQIKARKGDNLTHLADRAGTSVGTIMKLNSGIKDKNKISTGQSIRVPTNTQGMKMGGKVKGYKKGGKPKGRGK